MRVALAPGEADRYWLHTDASEFVAEVDRWAIDQLLDAEAEHFRAPEEKDAAGSEGEEDETRQDDGGKG